MEHSYSKDVHPKGNVEVMATRSILIPRPPQCPSCYQHTTSDDILSKLENNQSDPYLDQVPPAINDNIAKMAMEETERLTRNVKNNNADDEDWDLKVNKFGWSRQQLQLYNQVSDILGYDQLARLAVTGRPNEGIIRRCSIDKSVQRMRSALAAVHWNVELTQWLNSTMLIYLPPTYMASYLDILQTLRAKVPTLVDKMLAGRPASFNQDYLQAIMKRPYGANVPTKSRKLPGQSPIIVIIPSTLNTASQQPSARLKRWLSLLGTMASTAPIQHSIRSGQSMESVSEQLVAITRSKIQDLRNEMPNRHIILIGINTGAAIAMQVALVESVSSIVCMGYAFNTIRGTRGAPDDRILDITIPVLFILGENSARSSQEEIESLRERMSAQTSLVVVGSADDALRINKFNRHLEGVTQSMVDNMIADEIQDFVSTCIINPPGPRKVSNYLNKRAVGATSSKKHESIRKRKHKDKADKGPPRKVGRPRLNRNNEVPSGNLTPERPKPTQAMLKQSNESIKMASQAIVPANEMPTLANEVVTITSSEQENNTTVNAPPPVLVTANLNQEIPIAAADNSVELQTTPSSAASPLLSSAITPPKIVQAGQFVQVKPPTTSGRVQSPNVKNFFIRKGINKQPSNQITTSPYITTQTASTPHTTSSLIPANKKIIIKSQQILVPANNMKSNASPILQMTPSISGTSTPISTINSSVIDTSASDLSGILDLPILFADNSDTSAPVNIDQSAQLLNTSGTSNILVSTSGDRSQIGSTSNIFISSADGKLPNRPVVISAAKVGKPIQQTTMASTPTSSKVILINRNNMKQQIITSPAVSGGQITKGLPTLKLVPTSAAQSMPITFNGNQLTKLAPGTKIDLSTLKLMKSNTPTGGIVKPLIINKAVSGTKNAIVLKSALSGNVQGHQVIKGNVLNRNITVRKVMNVVPGSKVTTTPTAITVATSPTKTISSVESSPAKTESSSSIASPEPDGQTASPAQVDITPQKPARRTRNNQQ